MAIQCVDCGLMFETDTESIRFIQLFIRIRAIPLLSLCSIDAVIMDSELRQEINSEWWDVQKMLRPVLTRQGPNKDWNLVPDLTLTLVTISINNSILSPGPRSKVSPSVKKIIDQPVRALCHCLAMWRCKNVPATNTDKCKLCSQRSNTMLNF